MNNNELIQSLVNSKLRGKEFLDELGSKLTHEPDVDYLMVADLTKYGNVAESFAFYQSGEKLPIFKYFLENTPCELVVNNVASSCFINNKLGEKFPHDKYVDMFDLKYYYGIPLLSDDDEVIGIFSIFGSQSQCEIKQNSIVHAMGTLKERVEREIQFVVMQERLESLEKEIPTDDIENSVIHDLANLLMIGHSSAYLLEENLNENSPSEKTTKLLDSLKRNYTRMEELISKYRDENSNPEKLVKTEIIELNTFVKDIDLGNYVLNLDVDLDVNFSEGEIFVFIEPEFLERTLVNLVINAINALSNSTVKEIQVTLGNKNGEAVIEVTDSGSGIPKDLQPKIFDKGFTTKESGFGVGLFHCQKWINQLEGRLILDKNKSQTTFVIELPLIHENMKLAV